MRRRVTKDFIRANAGANPPTPATIAVEHLDDLPAVKLLAVVYMRVSRREQGQAGNLKRRTRNLRRTLRARGIEWAACFIETVTGTSLGERPKLRAAIVKAAHLQAENPGQVVAVVTDTRNRFVRGRHYNGTASSDQPSEDQYRELSELAGGVTLATVLHPDASFDQVRSHETRIAGERVGRPRKRPTRRPGWKKARRDALRSEAEKLRASGASLRQIQAAINVAHRTVADWLKRGPDR